MLPRPPDGLTFGDVTALVQAGLREGRTLDFKQSGVGARDEDKREFLADVSAFANAAGGDILYGVTESQGEATGVPGIELDDADAEILRLQNVLQTGLEPRLPRVDLHWIPADGRRGVLIIRVPRSYISPHRVSFRDHAKFYARNNAGKAALDVSELRTAFLATDGLNQSIRRFRNERLAVIEAGQEPIKLRRGAKVALHVLPLEAFTAPRDINLKHHRDMLFPVGSMSGGMTGTYTLEGLMSFVGQEEFQDGVFNYALFFRSGIIESVSSIGFSDEHGPFVAASSIEWSVIQALESYRRELKEKGVGLPLYVFISLVGVMRHRLVGSSIHPFFRTRSLKADVLMLPEIVITDQTQTTMEVLRPVYDRLWNAFGQERSPSFDAQGAYVGERY